MSKNEQKSTSKTPADRELFKSIRLELGYTQAQMADLLGLNRSYLTALESGARPITWKLLGKVSKLEREILGNLPPDLDCGIDAIINEIKGLIERCQLLSQAELGDLIDDATESMARIGPGPGDFYGPILLILHSELRRRHREVIANKKSGAPKDLEKSDLTKKVDSLTTERVKAALPKLIERLNKVTEPRGRKSELASALGVHRQMVTDWLSGKQEPGGEITLQLLQWVERQERQK